MKTRAIIAVIAATVLCAGSRTVVLGQNGQHGHHGHFAAARASALASALALPTSATMRTLLEAAVHTSEFVDVPAGSRPLTRAYVSYPDRPDKAPVVLVNTDPGMGDVARALAFQAAREGFIGIAPQRHGGAGDAAALRRFAASLPSAADAVATLDIRDGRIAARVGGGPSTSFALNDEGWSSALRLLSEQTGNRLTPVAGMDHVEMEMRATAVQAQAGGQGAAPGRQGAAPGGPRRAPGLNEKPDDLPANWVMADKVANTTPRRNEWVDIPVAGTSVKMHTWVVYPDGAERVGAVLVLPGASGMSDWIRSVADQLAKDGFIALAVDLSSGLGPNGGHYDSFRYMDERMRATQTLGRDAVMARIKAVRDYAAKMPRSNGRTGSIGFCGGGTNSFALATEVPEHNASVTYYGAAPPAAALAKINAPVLGFYGENDVRIFSTVEPTRAEMKRLGKTYEAHTYPAATHSFLWMQDLGNNFEATADSWPRTIAFYRQHLGGAAANR